MLVDDHPLFLEGLTYLLQTHGVEVAGTANDGREGLEKARLLKPDIILMDIRMPGLGGLDALKLIKAEMPEIKIVMLTTSDEEEDFFDAVKYGASGFLLKSTNASQLVGLLKDLENDGVTLSSELAARLLMEFQGIASEEDQFIPSTIIEDKREQLSQRQLEILEMISTGITYKESGELLGLTERTVKYHMGRIIELLQLKNRTQVIAYAARMGLVKDAEKDRGNE